MHRKEPFQHRERNGEKDAAVGGSCGEFFPEDEHSDDEQNHACDKVKVTCRNESGFSDKNGKTGNSAKSEIIRKFKKVCSECNKKRAECIKMRRYCINKRIERKKINKETVYG